MLGDLVGSLVIKAMPFERDCIMEALQWIAALIFDSELDMSELQVGLSKIMHAGRQQHWPAHTIDLPDTHAMYTPGAKQQRLSSAKFEVPGLA